MTNGADHERIWLQPTCCAGYDGRLWCQDNVFDDGECEDGAKATEYVRADLAATRRPSPSSDIEKLVERIQRHIAQMETHPPGGSRELVPLHTIRAVLEARAALTATG